MDGSRTMGAIMALTVLGEVPSSPDAPRLSTKERALAVGMASMAVALVLIIILSILALQVNWSFRVADDSFVRYYDADLAIDSQGAIHVVGSHQKVLYTPIDGVTYATNSDGRWKSEILSEGYPDGLCIATDSNNDVHIVYGLQNKSTTASPSNRTLVYCTNSDGSWSKQTLDTQWYFRQMTPDSMTIDKDDNVHICYTRGENGGGYDVQTLVYATDKGGSWNFESLMNSSLEYATWRCDIALEGGESPRIAAKVDSAGTVLYFSKSDSGIWSHERIDPGIGGQGSRPALGFDSDNNANVFFSQYSSDKGDTVLYRATEVAGEWHYSEIAIGDNPIPLGATSDPSGAIRLHYGLSHSGYVDRHLLAVIDGGEIHTETILVQSSVSIGESVRTDEDGTTYIAAYGDQLGYLTDSVKMADRIVANDLWFLLGGGTIAVAIAYCVRILRIYGRMRT